MGGRQTKYPGRLQTFFGPVLLFVLLFVAAPCVRSQDDTNRKLKIASNQHEVILLLIESRSFDKIEQEWKKVLDLELGGKFESPVAQSIENIALRLSDAKQMSLALKLLDESLASVPFGCQNKADIFKLKAYLYKESGDLDSAIQAYRRASELAAKCSPVQ